MAKGTLTIIEPSGVVTTSRVESAKGPSLEVLQKGVGGYIERVKVRYNGKVRDAYCNEDGLSQGLEYNHDATMLCRGTIFEGVSIVGNLVIWEPDAKVKKS
jgi:hypothetical protein